MIARLVIAEITSLDALSRFMDECSDKNDITISGSSSGDNSDKSVEWIKSVLAEIDGDDDKQGARGGKDDDESCRGKGLGRRMECFESLEAEGREMWGRYVGVAREEGQEVPTRVLFDRRVPAAAAVAAVTGAGGESGGGSVERGKGWEKGDGTGDGDGDGEGETQR